MTFRGQDHATFSECHLLVNVYGNCLRQLCSAILSLFCKRPCLVPRAVRGRDTAKQFTSQTVLTTLYINKRRHRMQKIVTTLNIAGHTRLNNSHDIWWFKSYCWRCCQAPRQCSKSKQSHSSLHIKGACAVIAHTNQRKLCYHTR